MRTLHAPRPFAILLLLAFASFVIFKCASYKYNQNREFFCRSGNYSESHPLICVNERTLQASPSHARVYDIEAKNGRPTGRPVTIHWFSQRTADLRITMKTQGCTEPVKCDRLGHCWATTMRLAEGQSHKVCTYAIELGDDTVDPEDDIVLNPCCH